MQVIQSSNDIHSNKLSLAFLGFAIQGTKGKHRSASAGIVLSGLFSIPLWLPSWHGFLDCNQSIHSQSVHWTTWVGHRVISHWHSVGGQLIGESPEWRPG